MLFTSPQGQSGKEGKSREWSVTVSHLFCPHRLGTGRVDFIVCSVNSIHLQRIHNLLLSATFICKLWTFHPQGFHLLCQHGAQLTHSTTIATIFRPVTGQKLGRGAVMVNMRTHSDSTGSGIYWWADSGSPVPVYRYKLPSSPVPVSIQYSRFIDINSLSSGIGLFYADSGFFDGKNLDF